MTTPSAPAAHAASDSHGSAGFPWLYLWTWLALCFLTWATYSVAQIDLGSWNLVAALAIAVLKSALVVLIFMHLWHSETVYRMVLGVAMLFVFTMMFFVLTDIPHRYHYANPLPAYVVNEPGKTPIPMEPPPDAHAEGAAAHE